MNPKERFTKMSDELIRLGLSPRLVMLYGRIAWHTENGKECFRKHLTLAGEIGLRDKKWITRLLARLRELKLIEWTRCGRYPSEYRALQPDLEWISNLVNRSRAIRYKVAEKPPQGWPGSHQTEVAARPPTKESIIKRDF